MTGISERQLFEGYGVAYDAPIKSTAAGASDAPEATAKAPVRHQIGSDPVTRTGASPKPRAAAYRS